MDLTGFSESTLVYWEKQGVDKLCGVHALNSLLQGPYFSEFDLAEIAQEVDREESEIYGGSPGVGADSKSNNVADDGNFSIQVLSMAMKRMGNLECQSIDSKENRNTDLSKEMGFICNNQYHWLTIRRIGETFYNLNSTNDLGPQIISDFYLSGLLNSVRQNGYSIFVVRGDFPVGDPAVLKLNSREHSRWLTKAEIRSSFVSWDECDGIWGLEDRSRNTRARNKEKRL